MPLDRKITHDSDDDDDGFSSCKLKPKTLDPLSGATAVRGVDYSHQADSDDAIKRASTEELYQHAQAQSENVTESIRECVQLTREMKEVATGTLVKLDNQGKQMDRIHDKVFDLDNILEKSGEIMHNIGGFFSRTFNLGDKRVQGPFENKKTQGAPANEADKQVEGKPSKNAMGELVADDSTNPEMLNLMKEKELQDDLLDEISESMNDLKSMVETIGETLEAQDEKLDTLAQDLDVAQTKTRKLADAGNRILRK